MAPAKGNDDVMAMLLALSSKPEEIEVPLISVTYGNVEAEKCLKNVVTMFSIIEKELAWRKANGLPEGFDTLRETKPIVAVGAHGPLGDRRIMADYFHGLDGLADTHETHPQFTPAETWRHLFEAPPSELPDSKVPEDPSVPAHDPPSSLFTPSNELSWKLILKILRENPPDTVSIAVIGPMTNLALAASEDPVTLLRAKEVIVMGGAVNKHGNITPLAEFNTFADAHAAAYVYSLSSPNPKFTEPPGVSPRQESSTTNGQSNGTTASAMAVKAFPEPAELGDRRLRVVLFPLDITEEHLLHERAFDARMRAQRIDGSPLAAWVAAWAGATFRKAESLFANPADMGGGGDVTFQLHDPMTIWYAIDGERNRHGWKVKRNVDIRVEAEGQWARGACFVDRRPPGLTYDDSFLAADTPGDHGGWRSERRGNRLGWCVRSPGEHLLSQLLLDAIFPPYQAP